MHTELELKSYNGRVFVRYYFNGILQREYNGNRLSLPIFPNKAKTKSDKAKLLNKLKYEFEKALEKGWSPLAPPQATPKKELNLEQSINKILANKLAGEYSRNYKRDLQKIAAKFLLFLTPAEKKRTADELEDDRIIEFLNGSGCSNRTYMNRRLSLNIFLPGTIKRTPRKKTAEYLHQIYSREQMLLVLNFLKINYPNLHLVALLAYGCLLRPHEESRLLKRKHILNERIYLSGDENKGRKVRVVHIPDYVTIELQPLLKKCKDSESYLFTGSNWCFNHDYFRTQWSRAKRKMLELRLIEQNQTLYSFRHTAAVNIYTKSKDVYIVQQILGHSDIVVTLKYLRGLGELCSDKQKEFIPSL